VESCHAVVALRIDVAAELNQFFDSSCAEARVDCEHEGRLALLVRVCGLQLASLDQLEQSLLIA